MTLGGILINRTPYAHYASLGALLTVVEVNSYLANKMHTPAARGTWLIALNSLRAAITLANATCRAGIADWHTPLDVGGLRALHDKMYSSQLGRWFVPWEQVADGINWPPQYLYDRIRPMRINFGGTIADHAESRVPGSGCIWPNVDYAQITKPRHLAHLPPVRSRTADKLTGRRVC
jgi:hypothetical protein